MTNPFEPDRYIPPDALRRLSQEARQRLSAEAQARTNRDLARSAITAAEEARRLEAHQAERRRILKAAAAFVTRPEALRHTAQQGLSRHFGEIAYFWDGYEWSTKSTSLVDPYNPHNWTAVRPQEVFSAAEVQAAVLQREGLAAKAMVVRGKKKELVSSANAADARLGGEGLMTVERDAYIFGVEITW
jgi:hypothetical protein